MNARILAPRNTLRSIARDSSGASAVEFALVLPAFITFVCAILYFGFTYYVATMVERAAFVAQEEIRFAKTRPTSASQVSSIVCGSIGKLVDCKRVIVQVAPLSSLSAASAEPTASSFNVIPGEAAILRIVCPPSPLLVAFASVFRLDPASMKVRANVFFHARA